MVTTGWVQQEDLPTRWLTREQGGVRQFMGANNQIFASFSEAYDFLYSNKERFDVREMTTFYSTYSKYSFQSPAATSSTIGMVNWMLDITKTKQNNEKKNQETLDEKEKNRRGRKVIRSKQGVTKRSFKEARQGKNDDAFIRLKTLVDGKANIDEIAKAVAHLKTFGWYLDPKMPPGWLKFNPHKSPIQYLVITPFCDKFSSKESAIESLKTRLQKNEIEREFLVKFLIGDTDIEHKLDTENDDDWEEDHESIPNGWKIRRAPDTIDSYEFLTSENICFSSRLAAYQVMTMEACSSSFSVQEHFELQGKLHFEGWVESKCLPSGWKMNRTSSISSFLTKTVRILSDINSVMTYIMDPANRISSSERRNIMKNISKLTSNESPAKLAALVLKGDKKKKIPVKEIKHPKLPEKWSFEKMTDKVVKITAATGEVFFSRLQALEFMIENDIESEFLLSLWDTLEDEDWIFGCNYVPDGWGVRKLDNNLLFLTKELAVLTSVDEALDYIENEDEYSPKDYKVLNDWKEIYISAAWIEDSLLPEGWKKTEMRLESEEEESQTEHFLSPTTDIFNGRVALIEQLIATEHEVEDIVRLWTTLDTESWMLDRLQVPLGWKIRFDCELNRDEFLAPDMRVLTSRQGIMDLVDSAQTPGERIMAEHIRRWANKV